MTRGRRELPTTNWWWRLDSAAAWDSRKTVASDRVPGVELVIARMSFARRLELMTRVRELAARLEYFDAANDGKNRMEASLLGARADARKAADDARRLEAAGRADAFAVVDAQRTLASVEQQLARIEVAIASDQIAVFLALGGGWTSEGANELATADAANGSLAANP